MSVLFPYTPISPLSRSSHIVSTPLSTIHRIHRYGLRRLQQVVTVKKQKVKHEHSEADVKVKKEE